MYIFLLSDIDIPGLETDGYEQTGYQLTRHHCERLRLTYENRN